MITIRYVVKELVLETGGNPYRDWLEQMDNKTKARIQARFLQVERGNLGVHEHVGDGVYELKYYFGAGYRVYFGKEKNRIILLLGGGDKKTQNKDIKKAQRVWAEWSKGGSK